MTIIRIFFLFVLILVFRHFAFTKNKNSLSKAFDNSNSTTYNHKKVLPKSVTFLFEFDNSNETINYNHGENNIIIKISKGEPSIIITENISYVQGKTECYLNSSEFNELGVGSLGHIDIDASLFFTGKWEKAKLIEKYKDYIKNKIKDKFL